MQWQEKLRELVDNWDSWAENYSKVMLLSTRCKNKECWKQLSLFKSPYLQDVEITSFGSMKYQTPNNRSEIFWGGKKITFMLFIYQWIPWFQKASNAGFGATHRGVELSLLFAFRKRLKLSLLLGEELINTELEQKLQAECIKPGLSCSLTRQRAPQINLLARFDAREKGKRPPPNTCKNYKQVHTC